MRTMFLLVVLSAFAPALACGNTPEDPGPSAPGSVKSPLASRRHDALERVRRQRNTAGVLLVSNDEPSSPFGSAFVSVHEGPRLAPCDRALVYDEGETTCTLNVCSDNSIPEFQAAGAVTVRGVLPTDLTLLPDDSEFNKYPSAFQEAPFWHGGERITIAVEGNASVRPFRLHAWAPARGLLSTPSWDSGSEVPSPVHRGSPLAFAWDAGSAPHQNRVTAEVSIVSEADLANGYKFVVCRTRFTSANMTIPPSVLGLISPGIGYGQIDALSESEHVVAGTDRWVGLESYMTTPSGSLAAGAVLDIQ